MSDGPASNETGGHEVADATQRVLFVRHAQSEHHVNGLTGGWTDTPLTALGRQQAHAIGQVLGRYQLAPGTLLYASDLQRAAETAQIIGTYCELPVALLPDLREINNGVAAGLTVAAAAQLQAPEPRSFDADWRPWPQAETYGEMALRVARVVSRLETAGVDAIVVGHGLSGQAFVAAWLCIPLALRVAFHMAPASLTELTINRWGERELTRANAVADWGLSADHP